MGLLISDFLRFGLPLGAGILGCGIGLLEYWNATAPQAFLKTRRFGRCHYICQTSRRITPSIINCITDYTDAFLFDIPSANIWSRALYLPE